MGMKRAVLFVTDMICSACETRIARAVKAIDGVIAVRVTLKGGRVDIEYDDEKTTSEAIKAAIENAGYTVGKNKNAPTMIAIGIGFILVSLYIIANASGLFNAIPAIDSSLGYGMLFIVGILTSVHCVAMCGGIALSQSVAQLDGCQMRGDTSRVLLADEKYKNLIPGLLYNSGRVVSYTIVGGAVGALGSVFSFSPVAKGIIAAAAGFFMIFFGLKMLGILSALPRIPRVIPAPIQNVANRFSSALRNRGPFAVGLLNGLMPCGPLQTMQLYALGTGSILAGALSMFIFSIGTVPLMLVFSLAAAFIPKKFVPVMVKASAVLVIFLGLITFSRAASLAGIALSGFPPFGSGLVQLSNGLPEAQTVRQSENGTNGGFIKANPQGSVQTVLTDFGSSGYYLPFAVQAGIPVKWTIRVTADGLNGCNNPITIPSYGIRKTLEPGDNLIEFTPEKEGVIVYTCWMGMVSSRITVVKDLAQANSLPGSKGLTPSDLLANGLQQGSGGISGLSGCCTAQPPVNQP